MNKYKIIIHVIFLKLKITLCLFSIITTFLGAPYFVSSTENTQYGVYLKTAKIEIKFVSVPEYISYEVFKNGSRFTNFTEFDYRNTKLTDTIYDKNVSVKGSILSLQIQLDTPEYFTSYQIVVKNVFGSSNHAIKLVSASKFKFIFSNKTAYIFIQVH